MVGTSSNKSVVCQFALTTLATVRFAVPLCKTQRLKGHGWKDEGEREREK